MLRAQHVVPANGRYGAERRRRGGSRERRQVVGEFVRRRLPSVGKRPQDDDSGR